MINTVVLGIDPGLYKTGYGIIEHNAGNFKYIEAGVIFTERTDSLAFRLKVIFESFETIIKKFNPSLVALERLFFNKNVSSAMKVSNAIGVILLASELQNRKIIQITPTEVKKYVTGDHKADKESVKKMMLISLGLQSLSGIQDVSDALGVALAGTYKNLQMD
ncbi:crossover junction endodeoxyribonuclease RuvC [bacterium]|nr:crossover junction endodeoxyribonuclease RuvC [bacterium]